MTADLGRPISARRARIGMMVIMPALAVGDEADEDVVAAVFVGLVVPVTPQMRHRINSPRNMPYEDGAYEHAEHHDAKSGLRRGIRRFACQPCHGESGAEE